MKKKKPEEYFQNVKKIIKSVTFKFENKNLTFSSY